jgi:hypothetical protein
VTGEERYAGADLDDWKPTDKDEIYSPTFRPEDDARWYAENRAAFKKGRLTLSKAKETSEGMMCGACCEKENGTEKGWKDKAGVEVGGAAGKS